MATSTRTRKTPTSFAVLGRDGKPSEYSVDIVPGESITIHARKVARRELTENWRANYFGPDRDEVIAWITAQGQDAQNELAGIIVDGDESAHEHTTHYYGRHNANDAIIGDWLEERGGKREWIRWINCFQVFENVYETTTIAYAIGDRAEHSSYNLSYLGHITQITAKTVTIEDQFQGTKRLNIEQFCSRNWDGLESKLKNNREWMD